MSAARKFALLNVGGTSWLIAEGYQDEAFFAAGFQWSHGRLIRATPHRRVLQVEGKHRAFLVKHFAATGISASLKEALRGSPAAREWKAIDQAQRRGLPVPGAVAVGEGGGIWKRESLLVTEFVEGSVSLGHYLFGPDRPVGSARQRVVEGVAKLIRAAHDLGFYQPDLHGGNILIQLSAQKFELFLIDLQRVVFGSSLSLRKRWRNLSVLNGGCTEASFTDRICFLKAYLSGPPPLIADVRKVAAQLERAGQKHRRRLWQSREKRCLAENQEFLKVKLGGFSGFARRDTWSDDFKDLTDGLHRSPAGLRIRSAEAARTKTASQLEFHGMTLRVNEYHSGGSRAWVAANHLRLRGIPVALPIAYLEKRSFWIPVESCIITEEVSGRTLSDAFAGLPSNGLSIQEKRRLLANFARFIAGMHSRGVACTDFKASDFIARERSPGKYDLHVVDFDGIRLGNISRRRRIENLSCLAQESCRYPCFTQRDRLRFLKAYLGGEKDKDWKRVWSQLAFRYYPWSWHNLRRWVLSFLPGIWEIYSYHVSRRLRQLQGSSEKDSI